MFLPWGDRGWGRSLLLPWVQQAPILALFPLQPLSAGRQAQSAARWEPEMTKEEELPDWSSSKEFYEKYEPKEVLGR